MPRQKSDAFDKSCKCCSFNIGTVIKQRTIEMVSDSVTSDKQLCTQPLFSDLLPVPVLLLFGIENFTPKLSLALQIRHKILLNSVHFIISRNIDYSRLY